MMPIRARRLRLLPLLAAAALVLSACDVQWGGARMRLEEPELPEPEAEKSPATEVEPVAELPSGPLLLLVRMDATGRARVAPAARITPSGLAPLGLPEDPSGEYRRRFADAFQPPGGVLSLRAGGDPVGTLILGEGRDPGNESCPVVSTGRVLLPPGSSPPEFGFVVSPGDSLRLPLAEPPPSTIRRNRVFAPILAERLLRDAGVARPFLAARARIDAVAFPGDTIPAMASTYLINDTLAAVPPPSGPSSSLFFLARYDRSEGFVPVWSRIRSYTDPGDKEALAYLGRMDLGGTRAYFVRLLTADDERLGAFRTGDPGGELWWEEGGDGCSALEALSGGPRRGGGPAPSPGGSGTGGGDAAGGGGTPSAPPDTSAGTTGAGAETAPPAGESDTAAGSARRG